MTEHNYIVIGAGSAGCTLAARLSQDPSVCVLLLESGGSDLNPLIHIPVGYVKTIDRPGVNWRPSPPMRNSVGLNRESSAAEDTIPSARRRGAGLR